MRFIQHLGGTFPSTIAVPGSEPSPEEMKGKKGKSKKKKHLSQDNQAVRGGLCSWLLGHKRSLGSVWCPDYELSMFAATNQPRHTENSFEKFSLDESL